MSPSLVDQTGFDLSTGARRGKKFFLLTAGEAAKKELARN